MERSGLFIVFFCFFSKFNKQCIKQRFFQNHLLFLSALPVWGSELTTKSLHYRGGDLVKIAATLNVKFWVLVVRGDWW
jgi:hypothetical protein